MTRPAGRPNNRTVRMKAILMEVFEKRGGVPAMLKWAAENETEFYKLWIRALPTEAKLDIAVNHVVHRNFTGRTIVESTAGRLDGPTSSTDGLGMVVAGVILANATDDDSEGFDDLDEDLTED